MRMTATHAGHEGHEMPAGEGGPPPIHHAPAEFGPFVDMRAANPSPRLDDPGVGLRDNGRRVLTYADLASVQAGSRRPGAGAHHRAAPDGQHGALHLVLQRPEDVRGRPHPAAARRARPLPARQRHDDGPPGPPARHVERPGGRGGPVQGAQAHARREGGPPAELSRDGRRARRLGLPLPPGAAHGHRHVPDRHRGGRRR